MLKSLQQLDSEMCDLLKQLEIIKLQIYGVRTNISAMMEAAQHSSPPTGSTCAICGEPASRHHADGHEYRP